mmetsp:Transcript_14606/g.25311  ORF Transcript_14606/g.25311 Transcript_14606/m.25311 type:complete len:222 (-) Transcript_14606:163-828(-)
MFHRIAFSLFTSASSYPTFVHNIGIVLLATNACRVFVKQKRVVHQSTSATQVRMVTVNKLLFRETDQFTSVKIMCTLDCDNRRKGPARAAHSLIFHGDHCSFLDPVHRIRQVILPLQCPAAPKFHGRGQRILDTRVGARLGRSHDARAVRAKLIQGSVFIESQIRKLVVSQRIRGTRNLRVVRFDEFMIIFPDAKSKFGLLFRLVRFSMIGSPGEKFIFQS